MAQHTISSLDQLRTLYREPDLSIAAKATSRVDAASARFIATSPFVMLATVAGDGRCDVSPRGGPPGFVRVLEGHHVAVPDMGGNNLRPPTPTPQPRPKTAQT